MLNGLDLFSGIGGITLALKPWIKPVAYCECDKYAQAVLLSRMHDGQLPCAPIWDDVTTLRGVDLPTPINVIYGGFPCQDISVAGAGAGLAGSRSGLISHVYRLARECRPRFIFLENVPALAVRGLDRVLLELNALGYDARWTIVSASEVGAPHLRERIWILAHAKRERIRHEPGRRRWQGGTDTATELEHDGAQENVAHADAMRELQPSGSKCDVRRWLGDSSQEMAHAAGERWRQRSDRIAEQAYAPLANAGGTRLPLTGLTGGVSEAQGEWPPTSFERGDCSPLWRDWWATEPDVDRVVNGLPMRVDRIKCLGNSVVPQAAREAFMRLMGIEIAKGARG